MFNRRTFLKNSTIITCSPAIPAFLQHSLHAAEKEKATTDNDGRILVVVQLDGGNDGINTVVPFKDEGYRQHRTQLRLKTELLIQLNQETGLHPSMRQLGELFEKSQLAIVQGVGYPNPNRSHFASMAIWQAADTRAARQGGNGWLGQSLVGTSNNNHPDSIFVGENELPVALRGRRSRAATVSDIKDLKVELEGLSTVQPDADDDLSAFLQRNVTSAIATSDALSKAEQKVNSKQRYPASELGQRLKLVSNLIKSGSQARVYYTSQEGYDTHAVQLNAHANLLDTFSDSVTIFLNDMQDAGLQERVLVLAFSEFGRRVFENGSVGTDHGTAGPVFLAGSKVNGGLHGTMPKLTDLDEGDLKFSTDFRDIYVSLLDHWLGLERPKFLKKHKSLPLVNA